MPRKASQMYQRVHSLGQLPPGARPLAAPPPMAPVAGPAQQPTSPAPRESSAFPGYVEVPAFYTITIILGGDENAAEGGSVPLRPEMFALRRITWATDYDALPYSLIPGTAGRVVEVSWGDEFTKFLGDRPCLISALFGDSNGFLDMPGDGILFQGRQSLNARIRRLAWTSELPPADTRWDFNFQGVGLLPFNTGGVSGSL